MDKHRIITVLYISDEITLILRIRGRMRHHYSMQHFSDYIKARFELT